VVETLARLISQHLTQDDGYPQLIVEPRPGADGTIAAQTVAESDPDGYTLLMTGSAILVAAQAYKIAYDPLAFEPVAMFATSPHMFFARKDLPANSIGELISYASKHPGELNFAAGSKGNLTYFEQELLWSMAGVEINHIAYKGGSETMLGVMRGEADVGASSVAGTLPFVQNGSLKALAVTSPKRLEALPDIPAVAETVPGYAVGGWQAMFAPAGTPEPIVEKLHKDIVAILDRPEIKAQMKQMGLEPPPATTRAEMKVFLKEEFDRWAGIKK
jgi:tripartite-type tricarboxylate transporter receptor subunit TctC